MEDWRKFVATLIGTFCALFALLVAFLVVLNPYGNLPRLLPVEHVIMDTNQRFQYPALIRSGSFDSAVFGTSSSRLLKPAQLEQIFGGRFANLAMDDGRAWEQAQLAKLFKQEVSQPRTLLFALDWVWCQHNADTARTTKRGWPNWIYDQVWWNDWLYLFNGRAVEISGRKLFHYIGINKARIPSNGYEVFVPPEEDYDLDRARQHIWKNRARIIPEQKAPFQPTAQEKASWRFPALTWLDEVLAMTPSGTRNIIALMPGHITTQAVPGTIQEARISECKTRISAISEKHDAHYVDFWIYSPITTTDENYWDPLHYRVPIAERIVAGIQAAVSNPSAASEDWSSSPPVKQ